MLRHDIAVFHDPFTVNGNELVSSIVEVPPSRFLEWLGLSR